MSKHSALDAEGNLTVPTQRVPKPVTNFSLQATTRVAATERDQVDEGFEQVGAWLRLVDREQPEEVWLLLFRKRLHRTDEVLEVVQAAEPLMLCGTQVEADSQ